MLERIDAARLHWIPAMVLLREIKERGYLGGITQLKELLSAHRQVKLEPVVRFETVLSKQMQIDFTHIRRGRDRWWRLSPQAGPKAHERDTRQVRSHQTLVRMVCFQE